MTVNPNLETSRNTHIMYKTLHHSKNSLILHESGAVPPQGLHHNSSKQQLKGNKYNNILQYKW